MQELSKLKIISFYIVFGILWISLSDIGLFKIIDEDFEEQNYKEWTYLFISTLFLYFLMSFFQQKNKETDSILTSVFEVIPDLLFIIKNDGTILEYRSQDESELYVPPEKFLGYTMQEVLPKKQGDLFTKHLEKTLESNSLEIFEYELKLNGKKQYFEARMSKLPFNDNAILIVRNISEQVQNQNQLKFQSSLLEQSLAATNVVDEEGLLSYVNSSYVEIWGYDSKKEILGKSPVSHFNDPKVAKDIIREVAKDGESIFPFTAKRKDGTTFDALMAVKYLYFEGKKFYMGSSIDITEKEKFTRQYETMFKYAREGIILHELDGTVIDVNPYVEKLHNLPKDKIIGTKVDSFFKSEESHKFEVLVRELVKEGRVKFEMEFKNLVGKLFFASVESHIIELDGRKIVQSSIKDLTEEVQNKLLITQSQKVFESLEEGVVITDLKGSIIDVNKAFEDITGYSSSDAMGNNMSMLKSGIQDVDFYQKMWKTLEKHLKWSGKVYNKNKNGEVYTSFLTISTIRDKQGGIQNYVGVFADISEVIKYEQEIKEKNTLLVQQSKMAVMGEMIDNVAHQWKQPLGMISMLNGLIKITDETSTNNEKDETIAESVNHIEREVEHLTSTINDFRNFFSPNKKHTEFLIGDLVERLLRLIGPRFKGENIEIVKNTNNVTVYSIENELVQVLMNIMNNAIDALADVKKGNKYIFINAFEENNNLVIFIKDNAGGIPTEVGKKIFESRFTTKEEGKGTGIGLYMSTQVMESLGGTLTFENSEYMHDGSNYKGAKFIITMPKH